MDEKRYNLRFGSPDDLKMGAAVFRLLDSTRRRNMLIYDILCALIEELGIENLSGREMVWAIEDWTHNRIRNADKSSPVSREDHSDVPKNTARDIESDQGSEPEMNPERFHNPTGRITDHYKLSDFMMN